MAVSLKSLGLGEFGKTGNVSLNDLAASNGYTRTFTTAATDYYRVNPFEVANGDAPAPAAGANNLFDWDGYVHTTVNVGSSFDITAITSNSATFSWTRPSGYTNDFGSVNQVFWYTECTGSVPPSLDCINNVNPYLIGNPASAIDGVSRTLTGLTDNTWYTIGIAAEWDRDGDGGSTGTQEVPANPSSVFYTTSNPLTVTTNTLRGTDKIVFKTDTTTTTTTACTTCCPVSLAFDLFDCTTACAGSPTAYYNSDASLNVGDTLYTTAGCSSTVVSGFYADGSTCYEVGSGGSVDAASAC